MATWDHAVRAMNADQVEFYAQQGWTCATGKCSAPVSHIVGYKLVTGRAGRVGIREFRVCTAHAGKFAVKHGLTMPGMEDAR